VCQPDKHGLDQLAEDGTERLPDTTLVVNPAWRRADAAVRRQRVLVTRAHAEFGAKQLSAGLEADAVAAFKKTKGQQLEQITQQEQTLQELKKAGQETPHQLPLKDLPQTERFAQLKTARKHFVDTLKLIAYRAETALVLLAREKLARLDDGRALVRQVLSSAADLHPDLQNKTLTVRLHRLATAAHDQSLQHLCAELTAAETIYPGTDLRLIFEPVAATHLP